MTKRIIWTGILAGVFMTIASVILSIAFNALFPFLKEAYMDTTIFRAASDPLMTLFWIYPLILGLVLSWIWGHTKKLFKGSAFARGAKFGIVYMIAYGIPMILVNIGSFSFPIVMILTWGIMGIVNGFVAGWTFAKFNK